MVRALSSHRCGSGSIPELDAICGLSLLLVLFSVPRFFCRYSGFPLSSKTNISKFQFDPDLSVRIATLWRCHCKCKFPFPFLVGRYVGSLEMMSVDLDLQCWYMKVMYLNCGLKLIAPIWLDTQLHRHRRGQGSNPVEAWIFRPSSLPHKERKQKKSARITHFKQQFYFHTLTSRSSRKRKKRNMQVHFQVRCMPEFYKNGHKYQYSVFIIS